MKSVILMFLSLFLSLSTVSRCQDDGNKNVQIPYPYAENNEYKNRTPRDQLNDKENNFSLMVDKTSGSNTVITISLMTPSEQVSEHSSPQYNTVSGEAIDDVILKETKRFKSSLATANGTTPHVSSLLINFLYPGNNSPEQDLGVLGDFDCGRPKIINSEVLTRQSDTREGDWPWHVALFRIESHISQYVCGGTLISKDVVLTVAHCLVRNDAPIAPTSIMVLIGAYNLNGENKGSQTKTVQKITVHENYNKVIYENDIALVQLKSKVIFSDYVQPACLWRNADLAKLPDPPIFGTLVGWGFTHDMELATTLQKIKVPMIPAVECIRSRPDFFARVLTRNKFCAGYRNGTAVCNGDSGGGFMVFVPDNTSDQSENPLGSWHIRGILSLGVVGANILCDPYEYSVYTDISKYLRWIVNNLGT